MRSLFFDSYAFFEIMEGNKNYKPYLEDVAIITTRLNLMELHYGLLIKFNKRVAADNFRELMKFCVDIDDDLIIASNEFRAAHKGKNLSYIDTIGYTLAKSRGVRFLTGDRQFKDLENVEFVV